MKPYFGELNPHQREYAEGILESSRHLLSLIDDILDLASIQAGRMELRKTRVDLRATLAGVLRGTRRRAAHHGLKLKVDCGRDVGPLVADGRRIGEVLSDLLNNAIAFTPRDRTVAIGARREGDDIMLWVADTGRGIEADQLEAVFGAFAGVQRPMERDPGAGLGLALAKSIIELHGGRIEIDSEPGWGTRVSCRIPSPPADDETARQLPQQLAISA